jgi:hypothetical protein
MRVLFCALVLTGCAACSTPADRRGSQDESEPADNASAPPEKPAEITEGVALAPIVDYTCQSDGAERTEILYGAFSYRTSASGETGGSVFPVF